MEDKTIVEMFWNRDETALSATAEKYGAYCMSISENIIGDHADAEECVNDAYMNTWNSIPTNRPARLSVYIGKIVRNLSFDRYRKKHAQKRSTGQMTLILDELSDLVADSVSPESVWEEKELILTVNDFLKTLSSEKRRIFICRYWYGDSVKSISAHFGMTENNVSVTLSRLRAELRGYLRERGFEL